MNPQAALFKKSGSVVVRGFRAWAAACQKKPVVALVTAVAAGWLAGRLTRNP